MLWLYDLLVLKIREEELLKKAKQKKSISDDLLKLANQDERYKFLK